MRLDVGRGEKGRRGLRSETPMRTGAAHLDRRRGAGRATWVKTRSSARPGLLDLQLVASDDENVGAGSMGVRHACDYGDQSRSSGPGHGHRLTERGGSAPGGWRVRPARCEEIVSVVTLADAPPRAEKIADATVASIGVTGEETHSRQTDGPSARQRHGSCHCTRRPTRDCREDGRGTGSRSRLFLRSSLTADAGGIAH